jgi:hypothetical protein
MMIKFINDCRRTIPKAENIKNIFTINGEPILSICNIPKYDKVLFVCKKYK